MTSSHTPVDAFDISTLLPKKLQKYKGESDEDFNNYKNDLDYAYRIGDGSLITSIRKEREAKIDAASQLREYNRRLQRRQLQFHQHDQRVLQRRLQQRQLNPHQPEPPVNHPPPNRVDRHPPNNLPPNNNRVDRHPHNPPSNRVAHRPSNPPPNQVERRTNNPPVSPPSSSKNPISCHIRFKTNASKSPRRSQRFPQRVQEQGIVRPRCRRSGRTANMKTITLDGIVKQAGLGNSIHKILSELFEHPFRPPWSGGEKGFIISINSACGNNRYLNIERPGYLRQSYSLSCCDQRRSPRSTTREGYVYGAGTGTVTFGDVATQLCCREMCGDMVRIRDTAQRVMEEAFKSDSSVNTGAMFNTCEVIFYYEEKEIRFHRDMTFINGKYSEKCNSQIENTAVGILVVGDSRDLEFALHNPAGQQIDDDPSIVNLSHGKLLLLHPNDEKDCMRCISGERRECHFRHRSKGVKSRAGELSVGFVFRCCKSRQLINKSTGQYIINKSEKSEKEVEFDSALDSYFKNTPLVKEHQRFLQDLFLPMRDKYLK
ncbi:hypothetical protein QTG54_011060 [Skeletonema marinoi]|uniref:Uncharacterized protein n=1 Tax=Skeletonema marinoi TaxID=267567 RepID=A0AAD8Y3Z9_9STRA|nr:hypothetical protein QTG54_011060 [Skeletonema marinoi]